MKLTTSSVSVPSKLPSAKRSCCASPSSNCTRLPDWRERHVCRSGVDTDDPAGERGGGHGGGQRAGSRPDVEEGIAVANAGEPNEQWRQVAAPPAHEALVGVGLREHRFLRRDGSQCRETTERSGECRCERGERRREGEEGEARMITPVANAPCTTRVAWAAWIVTPVSIVRPPPRRPGTGGCPGTPLSCARPLSSPSWPGRWRPAGRWRAAMRRAWRRCRTAPSATPPCTPSRPWSGSSR